MRASLLLLVPKRQFDNQTEGDDAHTQAPFSLERLPIAVS